MEQQYETVSGFNIPRNYFNTSRRNTISMSVGDLVPVYLDIMLPNQITKLRNRVVIRQNPTLNPSFSNYKMVIRYFVVSMRTLDKNIYNFISGFKEYGQEKYEGTLKKWKPSSFEITKAGELWDYFGFPINCLPDDNSLPIDMPRQAYNAIYDYYFRNQTIQKSILEGGDPAKSTNEKILKVNWDRDYFTTALPFQQLGDPIGIPITGDAQVQFEDWNTNDVRSNPFAMDTYTWSSGAIDNQGATLAVERPSAFDMNVEVKAAFGLNQGESKNINAGQSRTKQEKLKEFLNNNIVDMSNVSSVLISELRLATALQKNAELLARGGIRDKEILRMYWGTSPSDETLGLPKYIGSSKVNVLTSEVLQTSATTSNSVLGDMGGHGLGVGASGDIKYHAKELCIIMGLAYIKPNTTYAQGMPRLWTINSKYDFPLPVFQHLSEQPVYKREILCASTKKYKRDGSIVGDDNTAESYNNDIWGFRPIYDYYRDSYDTIAGLLHREEFYTDANNTETLNNYSNWTETRFFSIKDGKRPALNNDFLECKIDNRNYAVTAKGIEGHQFLVDINHESHNWKPLSLYGEPSNI